MTVLKIVTAVLGLAFLLFGYFIFFRRKYDLINDFKAEYEAGRKGEDYARRVGLIEFVLGLALLLGSLLLMLFA